MNSAEQAKLRVRLQKVASRCSKDEHEFILMCRFAEELKRDGFTVAGKFSKFLKGIPEIVEIDSSEFCFPKIKIKEIYISKNTENINFLVKKYYRVEAKCGHVGRDKYYRGAFFVASENGREAAAMVRKMPRVKHNHKDAILCVKKIDKEEFKQGLKEQKNNPYFTCLSLQEQNTKYDIIKENIFEENREQSEYIDWESKKKLKFLKSDYERKQNKYPHYLWEAA
ncbi:hypothetical protein AGMMS49938_18850 [Fibrobacterales bacterium]|nr:hypothetical protein AGMMS49938_18850 [Fibrobacterales bacterium]